MIVFFDSIYEVVCVATQSAIVSYVSYEREGHDKSDWRDLFSPNEQNERRTSLKTGDSVAVTVTVMRVR